MTELSITVLQFVIIPDDGSTILQSMVGGSDTFNGSPYNEIWNGYNGNDVMNGNGGDDTVEDSAGSGALQDGPGNDTLGRQWS